MALASQEIVPIPRISGAVLLVRLPVLETVGFDYSDGDEASLPTPVFVPATANSWIVSVFAGGAFPIPWGGTRPNTLRADRGVDSRLLTWLSVALRWAVVWTIVGSGRVVVGAVMSWGVSAMWWGGNGLGVGSGKLGLLD